jgi:cytochrome oxidase Cu insertion factor (SCO1/SenC/PrrC family)
LRNEAVANYSGGSGRISWSHCDGHYCILSAIATGEATDRGPDADKLNVLFISIDPEPDTSAHLKE